MCYSLKNVILLKQTEKMDLTNNQAKSIKNDSCMCHTDTCMGHSTELVQSWLETSGKKRVCVPTWLYANSIISKVDYTFLVIAELIVILYCQ